MALTPEDIHQIKKLVGTKVINVISTGGASSLVGGVGPQGPQGGPGPTGPVGPAGLNGQDGTELLTQYIEILLDLGYELPDDVIALID